MKSFILASLLTTVRQLSKMTSLWNLDKLKTKLDVTDGSEYTAAKKKYDDLVKQFLLIKVLIHQFNTGCYR